MTNSNKFLWRILQTAVWLLGVGIVVALFWWPEIGIHSFWNILIPVAPALLATAPGLWRNICPMASNALVLRHTGKSARKPVSSKWQGRFFLIGVVLLYAIVPLRHVILDLNGPSTGIALLATAGLAIIMGSQFEWKSGWCSGICPVHPVERLYGSSPVASLPNAHCFPCEQCVTPCTDAAEGLDPLSIPNGKSRQIAGSLMVGGFAGFIWGWFQVPDYADGEGWAHLGQAFAWPLSGTVVTLALFHLLKPRVSPVLLRRVFAAAAIACYYWYRLPALFGYGLFPKDGMLIDLRDSLGTSFPYISRVLTTAFFFWWLVGRRNLNRSWLIRPAMAKVQNQDS
jgi:hypothetical protein